MRRLGALAAVSILLNVCVAAAQTLPELFQKAKAQVKGESWQNALKTFSLLEAEASKLGNESARQQLAAPLAFYRGVCEANLGNAEKARMEFAAFLLLEPNASMDPSMYSKKAIAAFQASRANAAPRVDDDGPSLFQAFQEFKLPPNPGEAVNASWADGPIRWIMTAEEKRRWAELMPGSDWQDFADQFWETRNPQPGSPDNAFKTAFERRVAYADANFIQAEGTRGSLTDRGMVLVLLGPPSYVGRKPMRTGEDTNDAAGLSRVGSRAESYLQRALTSAGEPAGSTSTLATDAFLGPGMRVMDTDPSWREVWHYRKELLPGSPGYQQVDVEFITRKGYGVAVLQRDPPVLAVLNTAQARFH